MSPYGTVEQTKIEEMIPVIVWVVMSIILYISICNLKQSIFISMLVSSLLYMPEAQTIIKKIINKLRHSK